MSSYTSPTVCQQKLFKKSQTNQFLLVETGSHTMFFFFLKKSLKKLVGGTLTLHMGAPSLSVYSLWVLCRVTQSTHTGSSSFSQYSSRGFRCRLQTASLGWMVFGRLFVCLRKVSQASLSARLAMALSISHTSLQTGQFLLYFQFFSRHSRQKLWVQGSSIGSRNMPWHTGQVRSCWRGKGSSSSMLSDMASQARFNLLSLSKTPKIDS